MKHLGIKSRFILDLLFLLLRVEALDHAVFAGIRWRYNDFVTLIEGCSLQHVVSLVDYPQLLLVFGDSFFLRLV